MFRVVLSASALKFLRKADPPVRRRLKQALVKLQDSPRDQPNVKALRGDYSGYFRLRVGDYRIVFQVVDEELIVVVLLVAHRSQAYR